jgi:hypothetical protein
VTLEQTTEAREALAVGQRAQQYALRVAHVENDRAERLARHLDLDLPDRRRDPHRHPEGLARSFAGDAREVFRAGLGLDREPGVDAWVVPERQRPESPDPVAGHFGTAAIGIEQPHRHRIPGPLVDDEAIGADAGVPIAHLARERIECGVPDLGSLHVQKVVAVGMCLCESHSFYFRQNASRCQPKRRTSGRGSALNVPTKAPL